MFWLRDRDFGEFRKALWRMPEALLTQEIRCPVGAVDVSLPAIQWPSGRGVPSVIDWDARWMDMRSGRPARFGDRGVGHMG